jgi:hypothetical protein
MIANIGTARIAPGTPHPVPEYQGQDHCHRIYREAVRQQHRRDDAPFHYVDAEIKARRQQGGPDRSFTDQSNRQEQNDSAERARIGTKFRQNATTPQSTGPGTSHSHITPAVAPPTAALITVIVNKYADRSRSTRSVISTASRLSEYLGKTSTNRRKKVPRTRAGKTGRGASQADEQCLCRPGLEHECQHDGHRDILCNVKTRKHGDKTEYAKENRPHVPRRRHPRTVLQPLTVGIEGIRRQVLFQPFKILTRHSLHGDLPS